MHDADIPIVMIPGTMTDWRMYTPQLEVFSNFIIPPWLPPLSTGEPLASYAQRMAASLDLPERYLFGGVSLGAMIAQEMALHAKPLGVIVIAGCTDSRAIPWYLRIQGRIGRYLPDVISRAILWLISKTVPRFLTDNIAHQRIFAQMVKDMSPRLVRWI